MSNIKTHLEILYTAGNDQQSYSINSITILSRGLRIHSITVLLIISSAISVDHSSELDTVPRNVSTKHDI